MKSEFTAIIEASPEGGFWAICPEISGANGQGETVEDAKHNLIEAIQLILEDRRLDFLRGLPDDAIQDKILVSTLQNKRNNYLGVHESSMHPNYSLSRRRSRA